MEKKKSEKKIFFVEKKHFFWNFSKNKMFCRKNNLFWFWTKNRSCEDSLQKFRQKKGKKGYSQFLKAILKNLKQLIQKSAVVRFLGCCWSFEKKLFWFLTKNGSCEDIILRRGETGVPPPNFFESRFFSPKFKTHNLNYIKSP